MANRIDLKITEEELRSLAREGSKPIEEKYVVMMKRVMIDNESAKTVAAEYNVTPQSISKRKMKIIERYNKLPSELKRLGFVSKTVIVHKSDVAALKAFERDSFLNHNKG